MDEIDRKIAVALQQDGSAGLAELAKVSGLSVSATAERVKRALDASGAFDAPIVTEIVPFERFHPAEAYHQDYFARNPLQGYCRAVVGPKVAKFEKAFADLLKKPPGGED